MAKKWRRTRKTFRHGNLPEALLQAALERLEADGADAISLRDLARDAGVNHRAVYRHYPDKLSLLARVAEEGWRRLAAQVRKMTADKPPGEGSLIAAGVGFFKFARASPNLFHLMGGPRMNTGGRFPQLEATVIDTLADFARGFAAAGTAPKDVRERTAVFVSALQGITTQILQRRLRVTPAKAEGFVADTCKRLVKGLR